MPMCRRFSLLFAAVLLAGLTAGPLRAQKIGYTNAEVILSMMPNFESVQQELRTYEQKLMERLNVKRSYGQTKMQEFMDKRESGEMTSEEESMRQKELMKLQKELQQSQTDAQKKLQQKRDELLAPLVEQMQNAIDAVRDSCPFLNNK